MSGLSGGRFTFDPLEQRGGACRGAERCTERTTWQSRELEVRARYDASHARDGARGATVGARDGATIWAERLPYTRHVLVGPRGRRRYELRQLGRQREREHAHAEERAASGLEGGLAQPERELDLSGRRGVAHREHTFLATLARREQRVEDGRGAVREPRLGTWLAEGEVDAVTRRADSDLEHPRGHHVSHAHGNARRVGHEARFVIVHEARVATGHDGDPEPERRRLRDEHHDALARLQRRRREAALLAHMPVDELDERVRRRGRNLCRGWRLLSHLIVPVHCPALFSRKVRFVAERHTDIEERTVAKRLQRERERERRWLQEEQGASSAAEEDGHHNQSRVVPTARSVSRRFLRGFRYEDTRVVRSVINLLPSGIA